MIIPIDLREHYNLYYIAWFLESKKYKTFLYGICVIYSIIKQLNQSIYMYVIKGGYK